MVRTNRDIVALISEYTDPSPTLYCRLAAVNRDFYHVFTSDKVWAPLDAYNLRSGIYKHYLKKTSSLHGLAKICWEEHDKNLEGLDFETIGNKYIELGYYITWEYDSDIPCTDRHLVGLVVDLKPMQVASLQEFRDDRELILRACRKDYNGTMGLYYGNDHLKYDRELCRRVIEVYCAGNYYNQPDPFKWFDRSIIDREMIEFAIGMCPGLTFVAERDAVSQGQKSALIEELITDRESLLNAIKGNSRALEMFPEYWNDKQLYLTAISYKHIYGLPLSLPQLDQWDDIEIATAAVALDPYFFASISPKYKSDVTVVKEMLKRCRVGYTCYPIGDIGRPALNDPEILGALFDLEMIPNTSVLPFEYYQELLTSLFDDLEWTKNRIRNSRWAWCSASERLKQDKSVLMLALKMLLVKDGVALIKKIPEKFHRDPDVIKAVLESGLLHLIPPENIPRKALVDHISKVGLKKYPQLTGDLEIVIAAIQTDPSQIKYASLALLESNYFKDYVINYHYELRYYWPDNWARGMVQRVLGSEPNWNIIPRSRALECVINVPESLGSIPKELLDVEFAASAVTKNRDVYYRLPVDLKNENRVQQSIRNDTTVKPLLYD